MTAGPELQRLAVLGGLHAHHPTVVVEDRAGDRVAGLQDRADLDRPVGEELVEVEPGAGEAVAGEAGQVGPVELEPDPAADDPQALVAAASPWPDRCRSPS